MPKIRGAVTDLDRRRFIRDAFAAIQQRSQGSLTELSRQNRDVDVDLLAIDATKFTAEIFVARKSRARCKIWIGGLTGGNEIAYSEGSTSQSSNSMNEALSLTEITGELALHTMRGMFGGRPDAPGRRQNSLFRSQISLFWPEIFPVLIAAVAEQQCGKMLEARAFRIVSSGGRSELPVIFPVSREFPWRTVRGGLRPPPAGCEDFSSHDGTPLCPK